jgi:hypothetical protein
MEMGFMDANDMIAIGYLYGLNDTDMNVLVTLRTKGERQSQIREFRKAIYEFKPKQQIG